MRKKILDWHDILEKEGLSDWKVEETSSGGLCMQSQKKILVLPNDDALFLHELAHAKAGIRKDWDKTGHDSIWGDVYTELVRKYLITPTGNHMRVTV